MNIQIINKIPEARYPVLLSMIHDSFCEYLNQGIVFTCSNYTLEDLRNKVLSGVCFIAVDGDDILGITSVSDIGNGVAYENITAVSPYAKNIGIGTMLYNKRKEYLKTNKYIYLKSDTAVKAIGSVNWHLKKCGCYIAGYQSYHSTNYYSYVFREYMGKCSFYIAIYLRLRFVLSFLFCRICKTENGAYTFIGRIVSTIRNIIRR